MLATSNQEVEVQLVEVTKRFGDVTAVESVSFTVHKGEFFSLLGPSGCGKTTTLRLIGGFEFPDTGEVYLNGRPMGRIPPNRRETNMVFQRLALFPHYSVFENVAFGLRMKRVPEAEIRRRVTTVLEMVQMSGFETRRITELSGGQQQRVALARALVNNPRVLLLDEPLSSLDLKLRLQMQEELKRLQRDLGTTFIYVTHDQGEALAMSDRIGIMNNGRLLQVGSPMEIYEHPSTPFVASFIGDTNLIQGSVDFVDEEVTAITASGLHLLVKRAGWETPGDQVYVCIRPERILMNSDRETGNVLHGKIQERLFKGHFVQYRIHVGPFTLQTTIPYGGSNRIFGMGEEVTISWDPHQAVLLQADEEGRNFDGYSPSRRDERAERTASTR
ncbi:MAG: ABC transporter ATP-binding protein [Armatimonadota bacterium]|nr:ABC transporter ATP-binding protein [Armatimonadota bacterium]